MNPMLNMDETSSRLWVRGIARGFRNVTRERRWFTAFGALFGVMFLLQILLFGLIGIKTVQTTLESRTDITIELRSDALDKERHELFAQIQQLPYVEEAAYITREQAFEHARLEDPELIAFLEKFDLENPFPDTIGVSLASFEGYEQFVVFIGKSTWRNIVSPTSLSTITNDETQVHDLIGLTRAGESFSIGILIVAGLALLFITIELVRRRSLDRAEEVFVEQLVGAHPLSIIVPFATEATALLWLASIASLFLLLIFLMVFPIFFPTFTSTGIMGAMGKELSAHSRSMFPIFFALELLFTPLIAFLGAWLGTRGMIRSKVLAVSRT